MTSTEIDSAGAELGARVLADIDDGPDVRLWREAILLELEARHLGYERGEIWARAAALEAGDVLE